MYTCCMYTDWLTFVMTCLGMVLGTFINTLKVTSVALALVVIVVIATSSFYYTKNIGPTLHKGIQ